MVHIIKKMCIFQRLSYFYVLLYPLAREAAFDKNIYLAAQFPSLLIVL